MDRHYTAPYGGSMSEIQTQLTVPPTLHRPDPDATLAALGKHTFCTLATTSPAGHPHVAGVLYQAVHGALYVSTGRASRKGRNIAANPNVAVVVPIRRAPVGPPSTIQFQSRAEILDTGDSHIRGLAAGGRIDAIIAHGELDLPGGCFLRIPLPRRVLTYGLGMSLIQLIRHPLAAAGLVELPLS